VVRKVNCGGHRTPSEMNGDDLKDVKREIRRHFGNKKNILRKNIIEL
jgi:hypothetical protein